MAPNRILLPERPAIDGEPLQRLLHGHRVVATSEHFYTHDGTPHLLVCVHYGLAHLEDGAPTSRSTTKSGKPRGEQEKDPEWKDILREENVALFETLRAWRSARARADAMPPYIVLTNAQLAPETLKALGELPGIGNGRLERFGRELLDVIKSGVVPRDMESAKKRKAASSQGKAANNGAKQDEAAHEAVRRSAMLGDWVSPFLGMALLERDRGCVGERALGWKDADDEGLEREGAALQREIGRERIAEAPVPRLFDYIQSQGDETHGIRCEAVEPRRHGKWGLRIPSR